MTSRSAYVEERLFLVCRVAILSVAVQLLCAAAHSPSGDRQQDEPPATGGTVRNHGMPHMSGHMYMTSLRSPKPGDREKADTIAAAAKTAISSYRDYRKALADGYEIFLPDVPQPCYHFTKYKYGLEA